MSDVKKIAEALEWKNPYHPEEWYDKRGCMMIGGKGLTDYATGPIVKKLNEMGWHVVFNRCAPSYPVRLCKIIGEDDNPFPSLEAAFLFALASTKEGERE